MLFHFPLRSPAEGTSPDMTVVMTSVVLLVLAVKIMKKNHTKKNRSLRCGCNDVRDAPKKDKCREMRLTFINVILKHMSKDYFFNRSTFV
jgi:hypothetical protein